MNPYWERRQQLEREGREQAQQLQQELLTPAALAELFGPAVPRGRIQPCFTLALPQQDVPLYLLRAVEAACGPPSDLRLLQNMRKEGLPLAVPVGVSSTIYNVLHPRPLISLTELG